MALNRHFYFSTSLSRCCNEKNIIDNYFFCVRLATIYSSDLKKKKKKRHMYNFSVFEWLKLDLCKAQIYPQRSVQSCTHGLGIPIAPIYVKRYSVTRQRKPTCTSTLCKLMCKLIKSFLVIKKLRVKRSV